MSKSKSDKKSSKKRHHSDDPSSHRKKRQRHSPPTASTSAANASPVNDSLYHTQPLSLYLPLAPIAQPYPTAGLCAEFLSPLLLTYYPPLDGIVLSYSNVRLSESPDTAPSNSNSAHSVLAKAVDAFAVSFVWLHADFLVFRPVKDASVEAFVHFQSPSQLSLVFLNLISLTIRKEHLPAAWRWVREDGENVGADSASPVKKSRQRREADAGSQGYFLNEEGGKVEGFITARIINFEVLTSKAEKRLGLLKMEASLVSDEEAADAGKRPAERAREREDGKAKTKSVGKPKGILRHSQDTSQDAMA